MDLLQLQYFQTIARLENITKASEILYVAQPNLSTSIKRLEQDLGVALFDRRKGKIRLTPAGKLFLSYVDGILAQLDDGISAVRESERQADDRVRVASGIVDLMGSLLDAFLSAHPDVSFHQLNCRNGEVADKVLSGDADFGFIFGPSPSQSLEYIQIDCCERVVQMARDHPLARKELVSLRDLNSQKLLCNLSRDDEDLLADLTRSGRCRPEIFFQCDDNRVEVSMLTRGGGVAVAPVSHYLKLVNGDPGLNLTCRRIREELPPARLGMIRRSGVRLSQASLQFYEIVSRFFQGESELAEAFTRTLPAR
jgi:DNA-binding transcriptional LysR family regulator